MVQLMSSVAESETSCSKNMPPVKSEVEDSPEKQHGPVHKRSKLDPPYLQHWIPENASLSISPWEYNPLEERSPLGLRLKKSPSFLDLIQMKLSQEKASKLATLAKKTHKPTAVACAATATDKLKASNFPVSLLRIGSWEYKSRHEGDLVAKCYFAKHKLVWEVLDGGLKNKIEIQWSDILALKASYPENEQETLDIVLGRQPLFFREVNPQPRKHTLWQATTDFTGGEASLNRRHFLQCPQGMLGKHFEKLVQCDPRLNFLSQQPETILESPYFGPRVSVFDDPKKSNHAFELKSEDGSAFIDMRHAATPSGTQLSFLKDKQEDFVGRTRGKSSLEIPLPSSVIHTNAIEELRTIGAKEPKFLSQLDQIKVPGFHPSMSTSDLVTHFLHSISEQITSGNPIFSSDDIRNRDIAAEITQYLFSDPPSTSASDEQSLTSRVNSLCCLLQKDPATAHTLQAKSEDFPDGHGDRKAAGINPLAALECETEAEDFSAPQHEFNDVSGCKKAPTMSRKDSVGELLLNLPRIASLPQFL